MGLNHVVITAVARDDLPDEGAEQFARCVAAVRAALPEATVEVLPADLHAREHLIDKVLDAGVHVYNHNVETVRRLSRLVRPQADYDRSLEVLRVVSRLAPAVIRKSGLMVGLGETYEEVLWTLSDLLEAGCQVVTIGQYLRPGPENLPVARYWHPEEFEDLARRALEMGFLAVAAGPLVRSSFDAGSLYRRALQAAGRHERA